MKYLNITILFFFFGLLITFIKSKHTINIMISGGKSQNSFGNINEIIFFTVELVDNYNPQFLKIITEVKNDNINQILSFYQQDSTYTERTQLFQSVKNKTEMWLNNAQIKNKFYFTLECSKFPCDIKFSVLEFDNFELKIGETYTYFVTEETKEMKFNIIKDSNLNYNFSKIVSIWAKGNKQILSELDAKNATRNSKYNGYLVKIDDDYQDLNYNFTIKGEIGDLINVGALIFDKNGFSSTFIEDNMLEVSGFLKRGLNRFNCFNLSKENTFEYDFFSYTQNNNQNYTLGLHSEYKIGCISLERFEEAFYSVKIIKKINENPMNEYQQHMLGMNYLIFLREGQTIKSITMKPEYDYNYLTFNIQKYLGKIIKASINSCDTYPKCEYNSNIIPKINLTSTSFSFSKNEIDKFSSSSIDKKQKVLFIKCEKGTKNMATEYLNSPYCLIEINVHTDKNQIVIFQSLPTYRYLPKFHEENLLIMNRVDYFNIDIDMFSILNIEIFSGNISINIIDGNNYLCEKKGNIYFYLVYKDILSLKIKSNNNSYYFINSYPAIMASNPNNTQNFFLVGGSYLYNLKKQNKELLFVDQISTLDLERKNKNPVFIGINAFCRINITEKQKQKSLQYFMEFNESYYYQDIEYFDDDHSLITKYYSINITEEKEYCNLLISSLGLDNKIDDNSESLLISTNNSYLFKFSPNYNIMKYSYPHTENYKDIKIEFNLLNKGNYKIYLFFNDILSKKQYNISKNESIIIKNNNFENGCNREDLVCKISFNIESLSQIESILQIKVITYDSDNSGNQKHKNNNQSYIKIGLIILGILVVLIIIIIIIIIIINKNKNKDLANKVNTISFVEDDNAILNKNSDEKDNDLLY